MTPEQIARLITEDPDEYRDLEDEDEFRRRNAIVHMDPIRQEVMDLLPPEIVQDERFRDNLEQMISLHSSPLEPGDPVDPWEISREIIQYYQDSR
jgi:hypothetical protein